MTVPLSLGPFGLRAQRRNTETLDAGPRLRGANLIYLTRILDVASYFSSVMTLCR